MLKEKKEEKKKVRTKEGKSYKIRWHRKMLEGSKKIHRFINKSLSTFFFNLISNRLEFYK